LIWAKNDDTVSYQNAFFLTFVAVLVLFSSNGHSAVAQSSRSGIDWLTICRNPLVDKYIVEPCETLTSSDGYQLTEEGKRVLICLLGGGLGKLLHIPDEELTLLAPVGGCGGAGTPSA